MATRTDAYVDTSAFIAFADRSDSYHLLFRRLFADPPSLMTTALVVAEGHGWFLRRYDRTRTLQFLAMIEAMTSLAIATVGPGEQEGAARVLRRFSDQDLSPSPMRWACTSWNHTGFEAVGPRISTSV